VGLGTAAGPVSAQQPSGANPTASAPGEQQLLRELGKIGGRVTVLDPKAAVLEQPQGRQYRGFREGLLPWIGAVAVLGMLLALAAFYFWRGRIRAEPGEITGRKILRFTAFERLTHWATATSFILLAISGLNYIFGKRLLMPLIGADAFASWTQWAKYAHFAFAWPFILGVLAMLVLWIRDNLPDRYDLAWLKAGGGFLGKGEPLAGRFNAGQKLVFWSVTVFGTTLALSGIVMLFPFALLDVNGMQAAQYVHATVAMVLIAIILAHIYIGTLGMQGAYDAMGSGEVDLGWARRHHRAWVDQQQAAAGTAPRPEQRSAPAE
jgi:formate dehydrogenase subunit gamma